MTQVSTDTRWTHALVGLRCIAFVPTVDKAPIWPHETRRYGKPTPGEITGMDGEYAYVVLDGEDDARRFFWTEIRPR